MFRRFLHESGRQHGTVCGSDSDVFWSDKFPSRPILNENVNVNA